MSQRFLKFFFITSLLILGGVLLNYTIVYATLTLDSTSLTSDGALTLKSASSSATTLGDPDQSGTITIASSTQTLTLNLGVGSGATTVNIATGTSTAKTINIGTGASLTHAITIGTASSTVLIGGNITLASSTDAMTLNLGANTGRHTVNIATGQATSTITIGSSSSTIVLNNFWTALPTSPMDGQEIVFEASLADKVYWNLKYQLVSSTWVMIGGPPLISEVTTLQTTASVSYAALATAGPSVALPLAGDYIVEIGFHGYNSGVNNQLLMSYDIGGTGAVDADSVFHDNPVVNTTIAISRAMLKTGLSAVTLTAKYKSGAGTSTFSKRWMKVTPIRVQ